MNVGMGRGAGHCPARFPMPRSRTGRASFPGIRLSSNHFAAEAAWDMTSDPGSALRIFAYLPIPDAPVTCSPSPVQTAFPSSLVGRDSDDYYESSVAIGSCPVGAGYRRCWSPTSSEAIRWRIGR
jgi:hypothetical protein